MCKGLRYQSIKMSSDGSDDDLLFEKVSSQKEAILYSEVPSDQKYKFKLKNSAGKTYILVEYTLNLGKKLPYSTTIKGLTLNLYLHYIIIKGLVCRIPSPQKINEITFLFYLFLRLTYRGKFVN